MEHYQNVIFPPIELQAETTKTSTGFSKDIMNSTSHFTEK